jgi:hypothetical protein
MTETETIACILCAGAKPRRAVIGYSCQQHHDRLGHALGEIDILYSLLPSLLQPGSAGGTDGTRGKRDSGPLPARADVLNLIGPTNPGDSSTEARIGPLPTLPLLQSWLRIAWEERNFSSRGEGQTMPSVVEHLQRNLDWICGQVWLDEFADDVRRAHRTLQDVCGEHRPRQIGTCPALVDRDGKHEPCGASLYASTYSDRVRCGSCGETWDRDRWRWLGQTMGVIAS